MTFNPPFGVEVGIIYCERSELLTTETKENPDPGQGGFLMFWEVSKCKIDICSGGFSVGLGRTKEHSALRSGGFLMFWEVSK